MKLWLILGFSGRERRQENGSPCDKCIASGSQSVSIKPSFILARFLIYRNAFLRNPQPKGWRVAIGRTRDAYPVDSDTRYLPASRNRSRPGNKRPHPKKTVDLGRSGRLRQRTVTVGEHQPRRAQSGHSADVRRELGGLSSTARHIDRGKASSRAGTCLSNLAGSGAFREAGIKSEF